MNIKQALLKLKASKGEEDHEEETAKEGKSSRAGNALIARTKHRLEVSSKTPEEKALNPVGKDKGLGIGSSSRGVISKTGHKLSGMLKQIQEELGTDVDKGEGIGNESGDIDVAGDIEIQGSQGTEKQDKQAPKGTKICKSTPDLHGAKGTSGSGTQPHSPSHPTPDALLSRLEKGLSQIIKDIPDNNSDRRTQMGEYITKIQALVLAKAELLLKDPSVYVPPSELIKLAQSLEDMSLAIRWSKKMEKIILANPSKMIAPGTRGAGWSLLSRVKEMSSATLKESKQDGRGSGPRNTNESLGVNLTDNSVALDLPDEDVKKVGG